MTFFAQVMHNQSESEFLVGSLAVLALCGFGVWRFVRWLRKRPNTPDPWNDQVAAEIAHDDATPLCHQCLAPHSTAVDFCPDCGASVGQYTNLLPYPYLFSIGHVLRIGTFGKFKHSMLTVAGFLLFSLVAYSRDVPFAFILPIYWFMLLRNPVGQAGLDPFADPPTGDIPPDRRPDET